MNAYRIGRGMVVAIALCVAVQAGAQNQHLVGQKVMTNKWGVKFKEGDRVTFMSEIAEVYEVEQVNGKWLWVVGNGRKGWVNRQDLEPYSTAIDYFSRQVRSDPNDTNFYHRALAWKAKGEYEMALGDMNESLRRDPDSAVYNARGNVRLDMEQYELAIADYGEAIRLGSIEHGSGDTTKGVWWESNNFSLNTPYNNRGVARESLEQYDLAIADYSEAIRIDPKYALAYRNRGDVWYAKKDYDLAIADYTEAIRLDPSSAYSHRNLAHACSAKKSYKKAIGYFATAIKLDPSSEWTHNSLAWLLATCEDRSLRDGERAVAVATKACELTDYENWHLVDTLAADYAEAGDFEQAVAHVLKAKELAVDEGGEYLDRVLALYESDKSYEAEES